ncbi:MAG TPA: L,D-transpeptidase [Sporichthyaceae bacterium]|jgi:hypothetical protein|nr:L,D-transpeptidase [Sporichthyaceae bacterium]
MASWRTGAAGTAAAAALAVGGLVGAHPAAAADPLDGMPAGCMTGLVICISQDDNTLRFIDHGITRLEIAVRFGAQRTPTRLGTFKIEWKDENHVSKMFASAMPYSLFFDGGQAIHYSSDFAARGYRGASHGCVNTRDIDATKQLFQWAKLGTRVIVYTADPAKQARVDQAAQLAKEQDQKDQQAQKDQQTPVTQQSQRDQRGQDQWDSDDGPDGPDDY